MSCRTARGLAVVGLLFLALPTRALAQRPDVPEPVTPGANLPSTQRPGPAPSGWLERILARIEDRQRAEPSGLYPWYGAIFPGGWIGGGPGWRRPVGSDGSIDAHAAVSLKGYTVARATAVLPSFAAWVPRVSVLAEGVNARDVSYYGVGHDTTEEARSSFRMRPVTLGATAVANPLRRVEVGGALNLVAIDTDNGSRAPGIGDAFDERTAPGLSASPRYVVFSAHAAYVPPPDAKGHAIPGGTYRLTWSRYTQRDGESLSFQRMDLDVRHLASLAHGAWVLAGRAAVSTTLVDDGNAVPYFLLPDLGGGSSLRSYQNWRFRDRHRVIVSAESRWRLSRFVDGAIFHDVGRVAASREDLGFRAARHATGFGIRVHTETATLLRIDVAHGREGTRLVFATSQAF